MKKLFFAAITLVMVTSGCNKAILHSRDKSYDPVTKKFDASREDTFNAAREALTRMGYKIRKEDPVEGTMDTVWESTKATSHYVDLFDRKDYGTIGAYFKIHVKVTDLQGKEEVAVKTETRSVIVGRLHTSNSEEEKVLAKITDLLRKDDFVMTNVGVTE